MGILRFRYFRADATDVAPARGADPVVVKLFATRLSAGHHSGHGYHEPGNRGAGGVGSQKDSERVQAVEGNARRAQRLIAGDQPQYRGITQADHAGLTRISQPVMTNLQVTFA